MPGPASDALSLTLPKASKSRARRRKIPKPPRWFWFAATMLVFSIAWAALDWLTGEWVSGILMSVYAGFWWKEALASWHDQQQTWQSFAVVAAATWVLIPLQIITGK